MKQSVYTYLWIVLLALLGFPAAANHILGGEISYQYVGMSGSGQKYQITLKLYGDCGSQNYLSYQLLNDPLTTPQVKIYKNSVFVESAFLKIDNIQSNINITPVCPDNLNATTCNNILNTIPGVKQFTYKDTVTLYGTAASWKFQFEGSISQDPNPSLAGRTTLIQNANVDNGASIMYLYATLNNQDGVNSSSVFNASPTPFFCLNQPQTYNLLASDPDNDNLTFALVPALAQSGVNLTFPYNITYYSPYSATAPLTAAAGTFSFSTINGQLNFTPVSQINSVVVERVTETRNGVEVGSSMREMAFIMLDSCQNQGPVLAVQNISNATFDSVNNIVHVCADNGTVSFSMPASDPDSDNVTMTVSNVPAWLAYTETGSGTQHPNANFTFNTNGLTPGTYTFFVKLMDDGCPVSVTQNIAITIQVHPHSSSYEVQDVGCYGTSYHWGNHVFTAPVSNFVDTFQNQYGCDSVVSLTLTFSPAPTTASYTDSGCGSLVYRNATYTTAMDFIDSIKNVHGCDSVYNHVVLNVWPQDETPHYITKIGCDSAIFEGATYLSDTNLTDTFRSIHGCDSFIRIVQIRIDTFDLRLASLPSDTLYEGELFKLQTSSNGYGYSVNAWTPADTFVNQTALYQYLYASQDMHVVVNGTSSNGCSDTGLANIVVLPLNTDVAVPNAFTPNGDGLNDNFKLVIPVKRGYEIQQFEVYNRYGQRVYNHTGSGDAAWNGMQNGQPCTNGVYFYNISIKFINGVSHHFSGDVTLIR